MALDPSGFGSAPLLPFEGRGWRHLAPSFDPLSGEGARLRGGRFNPPGSFPVLYICRSRPCAVSELERLGTLQGIGVEGLFPRDLYAYDISLERVLDATNPAVRRGIGIDLDLLVAPEWTICQEIGTVFHALGAQGILSPSATGVGEVLALFIQNLGMGHVESSFVERWTSKADL